MAGSGTDGVACGSVDKFCPAGSGSPSDVQSGYYTTGGTVTTRSGESQCEAGTWCSGGMRTECIAGMVACNRRLNACVHSGLVVFQL